MIEPTPSTALFHQRIKNDRLEAALGAQRAASEAAIGVGALVAAAEGALRSARENEGRAKGLQRRKLVVLSQKETACESSNVTIILIRTIYAYVFCSFLDCSMMIPSAILHGIVM